MKIIRTLLVAGGLAMAASGCDTVVQETHGYFWYTCREYKSGTIEAKKGNKIARGKKGRDWRKLYVKNMQLGEALDMLDTCKYRLNFQGDGVKQPYRKRRRMRYHRNHR